VEFLTDVTSCTQPISLNPYRFSRSFQEELRSFGHYVNQGFYLKYGSICFVYGQERWYLVNVCRYCALNAVAIKIQYPLPHIEDMFDS
jgi:hypothetical protein